MPDVIVVLVSFVNLSTDISLADYNLNYFFYNFYDSCNLVIVINCLRS